MGRGGGGGGSRGGGGGGGRMSGGRIGGGGGHRGGFGQSRPSSSSFRPSSSSRPSSNSSRPSSSSSRPNNSFRPAGGNSRGFGGSSGPRVTVRMGPSYGRSFSGGPQYSGGFGGGLASGILGITVLVVVVLVGMIASFSGVGSSSSASITPSTIERTPLAAGAVNETEYFTDELGWIGSSTKLEAGMKHFYQKTGVQPYLYITDSINGEHIATQENMDAYANQLYDELFTDEAHILVLFHEYNSDSNYSTWYVTGKQAKTVVDQEGADILLDYIDHYYYSDYGEDEMFSLAFRDAADRMMHVEKSMAPALFLTGMVLAILVLLFVWWKQKVKRDKEKAEETERILNADIDRLS